MIFKFHRACVFSMFPDCSPERIVCGFVLFAGQSALFLPWLFLFRGLPAPFRSSVEAMSQLRRGPGRGRKANNKELCFKDQSISCFLQVTSKRQYAVLIWDGGGFSPPINSRLKHDFIYCL